METLTHIVRNGIEMNLRKKNLTIPQAYRIVSQFDKKSTELAQYLIDWDEDSVKNVGEWSMWNLNWVSQHLFEMMSHLDKKTDLLEINNQLEAIA